MQRFNDVTIRRCNVKSCGLTMYSPFATKRMLGIDFFVGTAAEAVAHISKNGGLVVARPRLHSSRCRMTPIMLAPLPMPISPLPTAAGLSSFGDCFGTKNLLAYLGSRFSKPC